MQFDPLTKYSTLIPGGLHYIPGGLNLPREKRMRSESSQSDWSPGIDGTAQFAKILRRFTVGLRKTLTTVCRITVAVPMSPISARQSGLWAAVLAEFRRPFHGMKRPTGLNSRCLRTSPPAALTPRLHNETSAFGESDPPPNRG